MSVVVGTRELPAPHRRARLRHLAPVVGIVPLAVALGAWQLLGSRDSVAFPVPSTWWHGVDRLRENGELFDSLRTTLYTFSVSLIVATVLGVLLGIVLGASAPVERAFTPLMDFFRTLPPPAVVPVAALILGATVRASVAIVVFAIIWPILLNTATAMREIPRVRLETAGAIGLSRFEAFYKVMLPSLAPAIMIGVRIALSISLIVTLLVDIIGHGSGIGRVLYERQQRFDSEAVWGLLFIIGVLGFALNAALVLMERRLPWTRQMRPS